MQQGLKLPDAKRLVLKTPIVQRYLAHSPLNLDSMMQLPNSTPVLRIVPEQGTGTPMVEIIAFLRDQADDIDETASRCTDPMIVSELRHISDRIRAEAVRLENA